MKDIKELMQDACAQWFITDKETIFKEEGSRIEITQKQEGDRDKILILEGGTREELYTQLLKTLIKEAFYSLPTI